MDYLDALRAWLETSALYTHFLTNLPVPLNNVYFDTLLCIGVLWLGARWISDQIHSASQRREVKNRQAEIKAKQQRLEDMQTQAEIDALNRAKVAAAQKNNMDDMMDWMRMCMMAQFMPKQQSQSAPVMSYDEYQARKAQTQAAQQASQVQAAYDTVPAPEQTPTVIPDSVPEVPESEKPKSPSILKSIGKTLVSTASTASSALSDAAGTLADKTADMAAERAKQAEANAEKRAKEKAKKEEERLEQAKIKKEKESERARLKAEEKAQREAEKKQKAEEKAQKEVEQKAEKENETVSTPAVPESALESVSEPQPMSEPAPTPTSVPDPQAEMDFESLIAAAAKTKPISDPEETEPVTEVVTEVTEKTEKINIAEIIPDSQNAPTNSFEALIAAAEKRDQVAQTLDAAKEQATDTLTRNQQILADKIKAEANTEYVKETKPQMDPERAAEIERKKKIALQAALKAKAKQEKKRR